jgi:hypothetical protein
MEKNVSKQNLHIKSSNELYLALKQSKEIGLVENLFDFLKKIHDLARNIRNEHVLTTQNLVILESHHKSFL